MVPLLAMVHLRVCDYPWLCPRQTLWRSYQPQLAIDHPLHARARLHMHFFVCSLPHYPWHLTCFFFLAEQVLNFVAVVIVNSPGFKCSTSFLPVQPAHQLCNSTSHVLIRTLDTNLQFQGTTSEVATFDLCPLNICVQ